MRTGVMRRSRLLRSWYMRSNIGVFAFEIIVFSLSYPKCYHKADLQLFLVHFSFELTVL